MNLSSRLFLGSMLPLVALLLFYPPQISAHGDERRDRPYDRLDDAHRRGYSDLRGLHSEFHEYPSTRRDHNHFHRWLKRERRDQHRVSNWHRDPAWDWRRHDDRWGRWDRKNWRHDSHSRNYNRHDRN